MPSEWDLEVDTKSSRPNYTVEDEADREPLAKFTNPGPTVILTSTLHSNTEDRLLSIGADNTPSLLEQISALKIQVNNQRFTLTPVPSWPQRPAWPPALS